LKRRVEWVVNLYHEPALVEEYLPGREFTVGVLGRKDCAQYTKLPHLYGKDGFHRFPVLEVDHTHSITPGVYGIDAKSLNYGEPGIPEFICPAKINSKLEAELNDLAIRGHNAIGAVDVSRVDFRMGSDGKPYMLEINTLPGLTPGFSDLCVLANAGGISYQELILEILYLGASRFGLIEKAEEVETEMAQMHAMNTMQRERVHQRQPVAAFRPVRSMLR
jgi:D-alanine-D-alanine ligase